MVQDGMGWDKTSILDKAHMEGSVRTDTPRKEGTGSDEEEEEEDGGGGGERIDGRKTGLGLRNA